MEMNLGGIVPLSTVDWPGKAAVVVFFRGCPLRCPHCQNDHLQRGTCMEDVGQVAETIRGAAPFVSCVVMSGGEALMQPEAVRKICMIARELSLEVGVETCGYRPETLDELLDEGLVDKVFLDVKGALRDPEYARATGRERVYPLVERSLEVCLTRGVPLEVRTTVFPEMPSAEEVREIADLLRDRGVEALCLQQGLPKDDEFEPLSEAEMKALAASIDWAGVWLKAPKRREE